jgi:hypothetical protein
VACDWHQVPISRTTKLDNDYKNTQSVRLFLALECGDAFKFDRAFMAWIRSEAPSNMGDEWIRLHWGDVET